MTKATETLSLFIKLTIAYALFYFGILPIPKVVKDEILPVLPFWALVSFGAYALGTLGYDVLTFKDKPEKYQELLEQIDAAKVDLRSKGVDVD